MSGRSDLETKLLSAERVAIIGVGGTGSHVLDYVSKTPVAEIALFDGDTFREHNAKRSPGAIVPGDVPPCTLKASYHAERYSRTRSGIRHCDDYISIANAADKLTGYTTVFLCMDGGGKVKQRILDVCMEAKVLLIDVGLAVVPWDGSHALTSLLRVVTCLPDEHAHAGEFMRLDGPAHRGDDNNNQAVELNAFNAALAVIRWKKALGVYAEHARELACLYDLRAGLLHPRYQSNGR